MEWESVEVDWPKLHLELDVPTETKFQKKYGGYFAYQQSTPFGFQLERSDPHCIKRGVTWNIIVISEYNVLMSVSSWFLRSHYLLKDCEKAQDWTDPNFASLWHLKPFDDKLMLFGLEKLYVDMHSFMLKMAKDLSVEDHEILSKLQFGDEELCNLAKRAGVIEGNVKQFHERRMSKKQFIELINMKEKMKPSAPREDSPEKMV